MRPSDRYKKMIKTARFCAKACGGDITDPNYRVNKMTGLVVLCIVVYFIFSMYTVAIKFSENWGILLESFCMIGTAIQGISKLVTGIIYTKPASEMNIFLENVYLQYEKKHKSYVDVLHSCVNRVALVLKGVAVIYFIIFSWFFSVPVILYLTTGQRHMMMQFFLPGIDIGTEKGYLMTIGAQATCLFFGAFGNFAGDVLMLIYNTHVVVFADIFNVKISELNEMLSISLEADKLYSQLKDIVEWHQKYSSYSKTCGLLFFWIIFTQVVTSALSIVLTLYIVFFGDWIGAYCYLVLEFSMLYLYCGVGTLAEITNDRFCDEIYAAHWYALPVQQQRNFLLMLMKSQDPNLITVGGVTPLNVSTGLQVTKSCYSIMMMMLNFTE